MGPSFIFAAGAYRAVGPRCGTTLDQEAGALRERQAVGSLTSTTSSCYVATVSLSPTMPNSDLHTAVPARVIVRGPFVHPQCQTHRDSAF
jgi:hypothetical protein